MKSVRILIISVILLAGLSVAIYFFLTKAIHTDDTENSHRILWENQISKAVEKAAAENKLVLVMVLPQSECTKCKKWEEFLEQVTLLDDFVLVRISPESEDYKQIITDDRWIPYTTRLPALALVNLGEEILWIQTEPNETTKSLIQNARTHEMPHTEQKESPEFPDPNSESRE